ncbi:MAG TPA: hypothetical protein VF894_11820 [Anaeromyxobacter sp.]
MSSHPSVDVGRTEPVPRAAIPGEKRYQELWLALASRPWRSLVLVPADPAGSAVEIARSFADVGNQLSDVPVTAVTVTSLEYGSALALVDLQQRVVRGERDTLAAAAARRTPLVEVTATAVEDLEPAPDVSIPRAHGGESLARTPAARLVIAIPAVCAEPLGLAVAKQADLVVLCVERARTRLSDVRRSADLIGRERMAGCFLVR